MMWWSMHGYAAYVWTAYGLAVAALMINGWCLRRQRHVTRRLLNKWWQNS